MDRRREAESARRGNDEYYGFSPLGFMGDSYFTQTPYYGNNPHETSRVGLGFEPSTSYTGPAPQVVQPTGYPPYYPQTPMDLDVLSAENYQTQRDYAQVSSVQRRGGERAPLFGINAGNRTRTITPSPPAGTRARRSRKESLKNTSADEANSARQRGRPRLETKDQTAAERRRTQIRLAQRAYRQRKETTISGLNNRVASLQKTIEDMQKTFLEFNDRAVASGIQKGAPALAGHLKSTAERLSELAKNSADESDVEEDENDPVRSVQPIAAQSRSRRQGRDSGPEAASMVGYQATFGEEEDEEEEDAGEIAAPPARILLDNHLPLSGWTGAESMQQLRSKVPQSSTRSLNNNIRPVQHGWVDVLDDNIEQFLRSKGLFLDGQFSVASGPIDPCLGSEERALRGSPSLNSSGGPHTPDSSDALWPNEPYPCAHGIFWNENTNAMRVSDVDMNHGFENSKGRL